MTEKSARNPTPGSFPHTGSALAAPRPGSGRRRCGDSAEPPWRSGERRPGPPGLGGGGAAAKGPHRSVRGRRAGEGGAAGSARRLPSYDRSWRADRGGARPARRSAHSRAPPRNAAQRRRGGLREPGGERRPAARPRVATSSAGESLPAVAPRPAGSRTDGWDGGGPPAAPCPRQRHRPRRRCAAERRRGCAQAEGLFTGQREADKAERDTPGLFAEGLGPVPPRRGSGGRRARWVSPRRGRFGDLR